MTSTIASSDSCAWNQQKVLETVRSLKALSSQEKAVLEQLLRKKNTKVEHIIKACASSKDFELSLVALAKQAADNETRSDEANTEIAQRSIEASFEKYTENKEALQTSSLKSILKILKKVEKKPSDVRSRRLQLGNVVVKKFITNVKGGPELISACGFQLVEDNKKKSSSYFLKDVNLQIIKLGIQLVSQRIEDLKSGNAVKAIIKQSTRVMCPCGFWGNIDQEGLCSVCYQKKVFGPPEKNTAKKVALKSPRPKNDRRIRLKKALLKLKALYRFKLGVKTESRVVQKNKKRCFSCNRKVGYLGFECRCLYVFCDVHRFPDTHCCTFDYKKFNQSKLKKENKQVIHEKLERID